tara:strand:+ start:736 stop:1506 length:771 start_codon:yes stop_codon:yes gene_type:complete
MEEAVKQQVLKQLKGKIVCPSGIEELNGVIILKNKLTKQLNNIYVKIDNINRLLDPINALIPPTKTGITVAQTAISAIAFIPSTVATPIPVGPILIAEKAIKILRTLIGKGEGTLGQGAAALSFLLEKLQLILDLLEIVDMAIEGCAANLPKDIDEDGNEIDLNLVDQEELSKALITSTEEQANQLSPIVNNTNGFDLSVITVEGADVGSLKRRRAIAKNKDNVIMLQGEPSFSSNDQILINELVFYIEQNNLKAE